MRFDVPGPPVQAARARVSFEQRHVYDPPNNVQYKRAIMLAFDAARRGQLPIAKGRPVYLNLAFVFPRPGAHFGTGRNAGVLKESAPYYHTVRPDADNLLKILKDALKGRAWHDDQQVSVVDMVKRYVVGGELPHARVVIDTIGVATRIAA